MTMYYSEIDGTEPTISIQVKDTKYTFTNESLARLIEEKEVVKTELLQVERKFRSTQFDVREFFQSKYETDSDEIVVEVNDVNELLRQIGSEELTKTWSATVTITTTITGVEAPNADAARELIENNIDVSYTDDGDLWVDDISIESVYPEA